MAIVTRAGKGVNLTANEVDNNFLELSGSVRGILRGTSNAATASYALTASYAMNASGAGMTIQNQNSLKESVGLVKFNAPITVSFNDNTASVNMPTPSILIKDDGTAQGNVTAIDFVGTTVELLDGTATITVDGGGVVDLSQVGSDVLPEFDGVYDLGATDKKWFDGYFTNQITIGTGSISDYDGDIAVSTNLVVQAVVSANAADLGNITISGSTISANSYGNPYADISASNTLTVDGGLEVIGNTVLSYPSASLYVGVWSYGDNLNEPRGNNSGDGNRYGAITATGNCQGGSGYSLTTEEYNGFSWYFGGAFDDFVYNTPIIGNPGAAQLVGNHFGGRVTKSYNGLVWSTDSYPLLFGYTEKGAAGTPSNGIAVGGQDQSGTVQNAVQIDNGTAWVGASNYYPGGRKYMGVAGTQAATIVAGGQESFNLMTITSHTYDGTTWSAIANILLGVVSAQMDGTPDQATLSGGNAEIQHNGGTTFQTQNKTQIWDGIAWSYGTNMLAGVYSAGSGGTASNSLTFGGAQVNPVAGTSANYTPFTQLYNTTTIGKPVLSYSAENGFLVLSQVSQSLDFADDSAAETGGVPLGGLYHSSGTIKIRLA